MIKLTQTEYGKFKSIMCSYFDSDGGEPPKSFTKHLFESSILEVVDDPAGYEDAASTEDMLFKMLKFEITQQAEHALFKRLRESFTDIVTLQRCSEIITGEEWWSEQEEILKEGTDGE